MGREGERKGERERASEWAAKCRREEEAAAVNFRTRIFKSTNLVFSQSNRDSNKIEPSSLVVKSDTLFPLFNIHHQKRRWGRNVRQPPALRFPICPPAPQPESWQRCQPSSLRWGGHENICVFPACPPAFCTLTSPASFSGPLQV